VDLKPSKILAVVFLLGLTLLLLAGPIRPGHALPPNISVVYVSPQPYLAAPSNVSTFTIGVRLNLTSGETINEFDVRLDYSNFQFANGIVHAQSIDHSNNIFSAGPNQFSYFVTVAGANSLLFGGNQSFRPVTPGFTGGHDVYLFAQRANVCGNSIEAGSGIGLAVWGDRLIVNANSVESPGLFALQASAFFVGGPERVSGHCTRFFLAPESTPGTLSLPPST